MYLLESTVHEHILAASLCHTRRHYSSRWHMSLTLATFLAVLPISQITAQGAAQRASTLADSSAVSIMAHVTPRGDPSWFLDIMQQRHRAVSESKLDALADSLVARAIAGTRSPSTVEVNGGLERRL